jgi:ABC-type transport system substrate-binding protein
MNRIAAWKRRRTAQAAYFKAGDQAYRLIGQLETETDPTERARLLTAYAAREFQMSLHNGAGWPKGDTPDDDGFTLTDSHHNAARITQLIAATETGHVHNRGRVPEWDAAIGEVLDQLMAERDPAKRAALLNELYVAAHPVIGGQAAETVEMLRRTYLRIALNHPTSTATEGTAS